MDNLNEKVFSIIHNWGNFDLDFVKVFEYDQDMRNLEKRWLVRTALIERDVDLDDIPVGIQGDISEFGKGYNDRNGDLKFDCKIYNSEIYFEPLGIEQDYLDDHEFSLEYVPATTFISFFN